MAKSGSTTVSKHVFLDYSEYERLLTAKQKNDELMEKVKNLEQKVSQLVENREKNQDGRGLPANLSSLIAVKEDANQLKTPLAGVLDSITFPPSATLPEETKKNWYFLGVPYNESK